jgi:Na+/H+ antiporter NhaD/arsenite permease-like protein
MAANAPVVAWRSWPGAILGGAVLGGVLALLPATLPATGAGHGVSVPAWLLLPFALLLVSIAGMPFVHLRFWERYYPAFAFFLAATVAAYYVVGLGAPGTAAIGQAAVEYFQFIALIGSLYLAGGGIHVEVQGRGRPLVNTGFLAAGALLTNIVGTTGASVLLIRPFLRLNEGRIRPFHVVFFIFIVSNCGGCLTPLGDPPLFLGFLRGVPFRWSLLQLWPMWLFVNALLLGMFCLLDARVPVTGGARGAVRVRVAGGACVVLLGGIILSVLVDAAWRKYPGLPRWPVGAVLQVVLGLAAYKLARPEILRRNEFTFGPILEVGLLFAGIFITMVPALAYLEQHAGELGLQSPAAFYFATGLLSALLDNAPTYLAFLQTAMGLYGLALDPAGMAQFLQDGTAPGGLLLAAISTGAVFFGAMTYIGNGPNFMVKAIAESAGVKMPGFFGYLGYSATILLAVLVLNGLRFV